MEIEKIDKLEIQREKQRNYNKVFYDKVKDKPNSICEICGCSYSYYNKSRHMKTNIHMLALLLKNRNGEISDIDLNKNNGVKRLQEKIYSKN